MIPAFLTKCLFFLSIYPNVSSTYRMKLHYDPLTCSDEYGKYEATMSVGSCDVPG